MNCHLNICFGNLYDMNCHLNICFGNLYDMNCHFNICFGNLYDMNCHLNICFGNKTYIYERLYGKVLHPLQKFLQMLVLWRMKKDLLS